MTTERRILLALALAGSAALAAPAGAQPLPLDGMPMVGGSPMHGERIGASEARGSTNIPIATPGNPEVFQGERDLGALTAQPTATPLEQPLDPKTYRCGPGDVLELNAWGRQNFRLRLVVDAEGRAFIAKVGYFVVAGQSLADAREQIRKGVLRFYPGLNVDISLTQPRSFLVHLADFVSHPGSYPARAVDRVATVLQRADPPATPGQADSERAHGSHRAITIERRDGSTLTADLLMYELTGDTKYNPYVIDGDVVRVPAIGPVVRVVGAVARPGSFELAKQKDLAELLALAGGPSATYTRKLPLRLVHRGKEQQAEQLTVASLDALPPLALQDGDSLFVPSTHDLERSVFLFGPVTGASAADEVTSVRKLPYYDGVTVRALLEQTGGVGVSADLKRAYIARKSGAVDPVDLEALLIRREFGADRPVEVGDTVVVPQRRLGVAVQGAVVTPGVYPHNDRFTVREYLAVAGGPSKQAQSEGNFRLVTPDGKTQKAKLDLVLKNGDTLYVPERSFSRGEIVQLVIGSATLVLGAISVGVLVLR